MHVHFVGVCGSGMAPLAGLLRSAGHRVTGSDVNFHPPMGPKLKDWGVETVEGFSPENLQPPPDLVVIGNVCRSANPEAAAAISSGISYASMPATLERLLLSKRKNLVVAGTHGKTTTTGALAYVLLESEKDPGYLVGGEPLDFESFAHGHDDGPFVIEGDEYDSAFFEKTPKFWQYRPFGALITSVEHDHFDIYRDVSSYEKAFEEFVSRVDPSGVLVCYGGDAAAVRISKKASCRVVYYGLDTDDSEEPLHWSAASAGVQYGAHYYDLFIGGSAAGRYSAMIHGRHNLRNLVGAIALLSETKQLSLQMAAGVAARYRGVRRRQEWVGSAHGVDVYDDFAHHPSAVVETIAAIRMKHPGRRILVAFEPRSATSSRNLHQVRYETAFDRADVVILAPVARKEIALQDRLDTNAIVEKIQAFGKEAVACTSTEEVLSNLVSSATSGDVVLFMSNGAFDQLVDRFFASLLIRPSRQ